MHFNQIEFASSVIKQLREQIEHLRIISSKLVKLSILEVHGGVVQLEVKD